LLLALSALAVPARSLGPDERRVDLAAEVELLEDPSGELDFDAVSGPDLAGHFRRLESPGQAVNLGFSASTFWLRVPLQRRAEAPESWLLEIAYTNLDYVDAYLPGQPPRLTGTHRPMSSRPFRERYFVFPLQLSTEPQFVYLRISSRHALTVPLRLWQPQARQQREGNALLLQYLYYGGLLALLLYHLLLGFSLRDRRFFLYALYALPLGLGMLAGNGLGRVLLWPHSHAFDEIAQSCLLGLAGSMALLFSREFLRTRQRQRWIDRLMAAIALLFLGLSALLLASLWWPLPVMLFNQLIYVCGLLMGALVLTASWLEYRRGQGGARFFLLSWAILWLGVLVASLRAFGLLPTNTLTAYAIQLSSVAEMLLLSLALAEIIHAERRAREAAQQQALEASRRSEERLEAAVQARTEQLRIQAEQLRERGEQLERSLASEKQVLAQYVRFGSMISHEFRNPLAVIDSQLRLLAKEHEQGRDRLDQRLPVAQRAVSRLARMFDQWLKSDRIGQSLQDISPHAIPLRPWLEHLVEGLYCLSEHRIELQLDPAAVQVVADDHLLEIALANLVENASKYAPAGSLITLQTRASPGRVGIAVIDLGPGIAPEHQQAVFEDFYRVQPEGGVRGMGLGLPIVQRIVQAHGGELRLESEPGQGCCFCIWLPAAAHDSDEES
jgi:signal transduction histidine kinase